MPFPGSSMAAMVRFVSQVLNTDSTCDQTHELTLGFFEPIFRRLASQNVRHGFRVTYHQPFGLKMQIAKYE
jgi:hypothetical protein